MIDLTELATGAGVEVKADPVPPGGSLAPARSRKSGRWILILVVLAGGAFCAKFLYGVFNPASTIGKSNVKDSSASVATSAVAVVAPISAPPAAGNKPDTSSGVVGVLGEKLTMSDGLVIRFADLDYQLRVQVPGRLGVEMDRAELPKLIPYRVSTDKPSDRGGSNGSAVGNGVKAADGLGTVSGLPAASGGGARVRNMQAGKMAN